MKRSFNLSILIATIAALLVNWNSAQAQTITTSEQFNIFMADYRNGTYYAALVNKDGDSVTPIKIEADHEDIMPSYGVMVTATLDMDDRGYTGVLHMYSDEYNQEFALNYTQIDESDSAHIIGYIRTENGITYGQIDGQDAQFKGFVTNGEVTKLRGADAFSVNGTGWLVQNGNLISYVVSNGEDTTPQPYTAKTIYVVAIYR